LSILLSIYKLITKAKERNVRKVISAFFLLLIAGITFASGLKTVFPGQVDQVTLRVRTLECPSEDPVPFTNVSIYINNEEYEGQMNAEGILAFHWDDSAEIPWTSVADGEGWFPRVITTSISVTDHYLTQ
jgi:hypothetical protein